MKQGCLQTWKRLETDSKILTRKSAPTYFVKLLIFLSYIGGIVMKSTFNTIFLVSTFALLNISNTTATENKKTRPILLLPLNTQLQHFAVQVYQVYPMPLAKFEINTRILKAALMFDALGATNIRYEPSSKKSNFFSELVKEDSLYLNAPLDLFIEHRGNAEELAIFYAALLEVNGITTALLNASGHPLVVFDTGIHRKYSGAISRDITSYLIKNYHVWLPIETALLGKPFHKAWEAASKRINYNIFDLWPVRDFVSGNSYATEVVLSEEKIDELYSMDANYFENEKNKIKLSKVTEIMQDNYSRSVSNLNIGIGYLKSGKYEQAISEFNEAIKVGGDVEKALFLTAKALSEKKDYVRMLETGRRLLQLNSRNPRGFKVIGSANIYLGRITEGEKYFEQAKFLEKNLLRVDGIYLETQRAVK